MDHTHSINIVLVYNTWYYRYALYGIVVIPYTVVKYKGNAWDAMDLEGAGASVLAELRQRWRLNLQAGIAITIVTKI